MPGTVLDQAFSGEITWTEIPPPTPAAGWSLGDRQRGRVDAMKQVWWLL